jgi:hypothetical protein
MQHGREITKPDIMAIRKIIQALSRIETRDCGAEAAI